jgi:tellurite resistance protein TerC
VLPVADPTGRRWERPPVEDTCLSPEEHARMELPVWFEIATFVGLTVLLLADLALVVRRPHEPSMKEAGLWVGFYVSLALIFGLIILAVTNGTFATEFYAGWLTEYSLSVDNLFVFVIIMARFRVPRYLQQEVLMIGIIIALVLRGLFILAGAALISRFTWVFYIFGVFLVYTAINLLRHRDEEDEYEENALIRQMRKVLPLTSDYEGNKIRVKKDGKRFYTPLVVVFLALGTTDLIFALDSIPAIFGLTREPFIVFTANVFALMGLRQLYFLLGGLLKRLVYLSIGLSFILAFIGVKLVMEAMAENTLPFINGGEHIEWVPHIPIWLSLTIILGTLVVATVASLLKTKGQLISVDEPVIEPEEAREVAGRGPEAAAEAEKRIKERLETGEHESR